jgi:hypothetical protein
VQSQLVALLEDRPLVAEMAALTLSVGVLDGADRMVDIIPRAVPAASRPGPVD